MKSGVSAIPQSQIETKISLTFGTKEAHMDSDRRVHGETTFPSPIEPAPAVTDFVYQALNKRYFLPCKQRGCENPIDCIKDGGSDLTCYNAQCDNDVIPTDAKFDGHDKWATVQKTIKVTITRPADLTEFGGEWVQSFPKDSWQNKTNEYEPYTFNDYGSKIPLAEFRPVTVDAVGRKIKLDAQDFPQVNVFMRMDEDGDYEIRYGNPHLSYPYDSKYGSDANWLPLGILEQHKKECAAITDEATCNDHALGDVTTCTWCVVDDDVTPRAVTCNPGKPTSTYVVGTGCEVADPTQKRRWVAV